jgi:hypothetical protein
MQKTHGVKSREGVVKDVDVAPKIERSCDVDALFLTAGKGNPTLSNFSEIATPVAYHEQMTRPA